MDCKEFAIDLSNHLFSYNDTDDEVVDSNQDLNLDTDNPTSFIFDLNNTISGIQNPKKFLKPHSSLRDDFIYLDKCNKRTEKMKN